ncbi:MFS general substrate transporter [Violaceomyces palustris]|uniref:MFS general substrate transporter n=1 Tax=Violaceomyces palustris TaxID=1673888 RepID=A0ACD0P167_9BASI|nr:MFS general substrate transporter [Violaceomyces palustris]
MSVDANTHVLSQGEKGEEDLVNSIDLEDGSKVDHVISQTVTLGADVGTMRALSIDNTVYLLPTPSDDPNDPFNWSRSYKWFVTIVTSMQVLLSTFISGGPAVALLQMAEEYETTIQQTAYLFTVPALLLGIGLLFWAPLIAKFGPRFVYVISSILVFVTGIWQAEAKTYASAMAARVCTALANGAAEGLAPVTIADIWFLHERGLPMAVLSGFMAVGTALGTILCGVVVQHTGSFRNAYWLITGMSGLTCFLICFCFPDTRFPREPMAFKTLQTPRHIDWSRKDSLFSRKSLRIWKGSQTKEGYFTLLVRPIGTWLLPAVVWAALVYAGIVAFMVAINTNVAAAFSPPPYLFSIQDIGFVGWSGVIGVIVGMAIGGPAIDWISARLIRRNGGVQEPEMRIPSIIVPLIFSPLGLSLYGAGVQHQWHWIVPVVGNGLTFFACTWGSSVSYSYLVDCYKPIAGEAISGMLALKSVLTFISSFYTNTWVENQGPQNAFGQMAGISAFCLSLGVLFVLYGKKWRQNANNSKLLAFLKWDDDRDDLVLQQGH